MEISASFCNRGVTQGGLHQMDGLSLIKGMAGAEAVKLLLSQGSVLLFLTLIAYAPKNSYNLLK
jgi:hypothetical protein